MNRLLFGVFVLLTAAAAIARQQPPAAPVIKHPTPGCASTPAQIDASKNLIVEFNRPGADRMALIDPSYIQHNPVSKKCAEENKVSDYEDFKTLGPGRRGGTNGGPAAGTQPPAGSPLEIVMAECDFVTVIHKNYRQDPTAAPGKFYEAFTFDTYRVRNGKMVEHWDGNLINQPASGTPIGRGQ